LAEPHGSSHEDAHAHRMRSSPKAPPICAAHSRGCCRSTRPSHALAPHDLRHTAASFAISSCARVKAARRILFRDYAGHLSRLVRGRPGRRQKRDSTPRCRCWRCGRARGPATRGQGSSKARTLSCSMSHASLRMRDFAFSDVTPRPLSTAVSARRIAGIRAMTCSV